MFGSFAPKFMSIFETLKFTYELFLKLYKINTTISVWNTNFFGFQTLSNCLVSKQFQFKTLSEIRTKILGVYIVSKCVWNLVNFVPFRHPDFRHFLYSNSFNDPLKRWQCKDLHGGRSLWHPNWAGQLCQVWLPFPEPPLAHTKINLKLLKFYKFFIVKSLCNN